MIFPDISMLFHDSFQIFQIFPNIFMIFPDFSGCFHVFPWSFHHFPIQKTEDAGAAGRAEPQVDAGARAHWEITATLCRDAAGVAELEGIPGVSQGPLGPLAGLVMTNIATWLIYG